MKQNVFLPQFRDAFKNMGRQDQFSYKALEILFNYLEESEDGSGEEYTLDVIALCCEYSEDSPRDIAKNYSIELDPAATDDAVVAETVTEYLQRHTTVIGTTSAGDIVYAQF